MAGALGGQARSARRYDRGTKDEGWWTPIGDSWTFLLVGSLGATGLAMALGTLAALVRYHRTGTWPGHEGDGGTAELSTGRLVSLWGRVVVGLAVAGYAAVSLDSAGLI